MTTVHRGFALALLLAWAGLSAGCGWLGLGRTDYSLPPAKLTPITESITVRQLWKTQVGAGSKQQSWLRLTPALAGNRLYAVSAEGQVMAVDGQSGQTLWQVATGAPLSSGPGVSDDGLVLVGDSQGQVLALRQENGQEVWRAQVSTEVLAAPRALNGIAVIRTGDGRFTAFNTRSGERRWGYSYALPALSLRGVAAPVLAQNLVIAGLETGKLLVLTLDQGQPLVEKTIALPRGRTEVERLIDIDSEPRIFDDHLYLVAYGGGVAALDLRGGGLVWQHDASSNAGLDVDQRQVYISDASGTVLALDRATGKPLWTQEALARRRLSAPIVVGNTVVVGDFEGYLHWLETRTGRIVGRVRAANQAIMATPRVNGSVVLVQGQDGVLAAFQAGTD